MGGVPFKSYEFEIQRAGDVTEKIHMGPELLVHQLGDFTLAIRPLTLREIIRDQYLIRTIKWLLNFDEPDRSPKAVETGSPWQAALSLQHFLDARNVFREAGIYSDVVAAIERAICGTEHFEGLAAWLLTQKCTDGRKIYWPQVASDTAYVIRALTQLRVEAEKNLNISEALLTRVKQACQGALMWLADNYSFHPNETVLDCLIFVSQKFPNEWKRYFLGTLHENQDKVFELFSNNSVNSIRRHLRGGDDENPAIISLPPIFHAEVLAQLDALQPREEAYDLILETFQLFQQTIDQIGEPAVATSRLAHYIRSRDILRTQGHDEIFHEFDSAEAQILSRLSSILQSEDSFENGSIFHDLYSTIYFVALLIAAYQNWKWSETPLEILNDRAVKLQNRMESFKILDERVMQLEEEQFHRQGVINRLLRTQAWYHIISSVILAFVLGFFGGFLGPRLGLQEDAFLTVLTFWIGILISGETTYISWVWRRYRSKVAKGKPQ